MTQKAIIKKCREILNKTAVDGFVVDSEDFKYLLAAFAKCPYFEMKTQGQKIKAIQKRKSGSYGTCCFFLIREDGSSTDISYTKMFRRDPQTDDVLNALRAAINPIISKFRYSFKPFEYDGKMIEKVEDADVDHYDLKFKEVASIWIELKGGVVELIKKVNSTEDGSTKTYFTDEALNEEFRTFHNSHTHLRFLPKEVNRKNQ
ncbi:DUF3223 domain-containing protein [Phocaeicola plebeius]|uniref:DUF3223 domain-containing protein n=1 Tax=Phocaeicola plebeius TaxID=310297 RepID=UPI002943AD03|nr:DUF3223 domain-containing protein [Phocaeicola plebeius]